MLEHSQPWANLGARLILGAAENIPLPPKSVDVLVSSLGDPYNGERFWSEIQRVLRPTGLALFTTPSYEWARSFRNANDSETTVAEFELSDGRHTLVPSYIFPVSQQIGSMRNHNLATKEVGEVPISALRESPISPKLLPQRGSGAAVVTGYAATGSDGRPSFPKIVGLVGHIGSGKTSVAKFLESKGFCRIAISEIVSEEASRRNVPANRASLRDLSNTLRRQLGSSVLVDRALVHYFSGLKSSPLVIDDLKNPAEVMAVRNSGGTVLGLHKSDPGQYRSAIQREADPNEPHWGQRVADSLMLADVIVENVGSLDELFGRVVDKISPELGLNSGLC